MAKKGSAKFSFVNEVHTGLMGVAEVTRSGSLRLRRGDVKKVLEESFTAGARAAAHPNHTQAPPASKNPALFLPKAPKGDVRKKDQLVFLYPRPAPGETAGR